MTQDQYGQAQGTGYVVPGEVVPDDEAEAFQAEHSGPMTRLRKVASALRGDQSDQTVPGQMVPDQAVSTSRDPARAGEPAAMSTPAAEDATEAGQYADAARPDDVGAVRSPDAEDRDYWDDETAPAAGATASDPSMTGEGTYGTTGVAPGAGSQADTAIGYGSLAGTATDPLGSTGTGLGATEAGIAESGTAESGTAESAPAGRHAAENAGLRPGEATDRLGDFGDIAFGNLLPDAAQYSSQWEQIQFRFVDDPQGSVTEAAEVVSQVTTRLEEAIRERQRAIEERQLAIQERASALRGRWGEGSNADTETLRETLRMYRAFMDQLIGPTS